MKSWLNGSILCAVVLCGGVLSWFASRPASVDAETPTKAPVVSNAQKSSVEGFKIVGAEPFWNVTIGKGGIVYQTPDTQPQTFSYVDPVAAQGRSLDSMRVYRLPGQSNVLMIQKGNCSDTMSDRVYPYSATLVLNDTVKTGCAVEQAP